MDAWITVVTFAGILFGSLVSIHFLLIKRAMKWLGGYTLLLTLSLVENLVSEFPTILTALGSLTLLYGPFLFLYVKARVMPYEPGSLSVLKHFIPFFTYALTIALSSSKHQHGDDGTLELVIYELLFIQIFTYIILSLRLIGQRTRWIGDDYLTDRMQTIFLKTLVYVSLLLFASSFLATHIFLLTEVRESTGFRFSIQIGLCMVLFIIALLNTETIQRENMVKSF